MLKTSIYNEVIRLDLARTLAGRGRYWTTAYLLEGLLIDTGCAHTAAELVRALEGRELTSIINTHSHEDHIGANGALQRLHPTLEARAHPRAIPLLADPRNQLRLQPYRQLFWGWPEASCAKPLADETWIEAENFRLQALHTPGHSRDHMCLFEPERGWLFTGDLFVGGRERALGADYDIWQIIASLKRMAALPVAVMFPGSARVRNQPRAELAAKIEYLEDLGGRVLDLHQRGWSVGAITGALCGRPMLIEIATGGNFARRNLVCSYLANRDFE